MRITLCKYDSQELRTGTALFSWDRKKAAPTTLADVFANTWDAIDLSVLSKLTSKEWRQLNPVHSSKCSLKILPFVPAAVRISLVTSVIKIIYEYDIHVINLYNFFHTTVDATYATCDAIKTTCALTHRWPHRGSSVRCGPHHGGPRARMPPRGRWLSEAEQRLAKRPAGRWLFLAFWEVFG